MNGAIGPSSNDPLTWISCKCINLGCGNDLLDDWLNVDRRFISSGGAAFCIMQNIFDPTELKDDYHDEIMACHVLEHVDKETGVVALKRWHKKLKPGGILWLATPNPLWIAEQISIGDIPNNVIYGQPDDPHRWLWHPTRLTEVLVGIGFKVEVCDPFGGTCNGSHHPCSLNLKATKQ